MFHVIQEDSDDEDNRTVDENDSGISVEDNEVDDISAINSWVHFYRRENSRAEAESSSGSCFLFFHLVVVYQKNKNENKQTDIFEFNNEYDYTAKECDEISLNSSIGSEEIVEDDLNVMSLLNAFFADIV